MRLLPLLLLALSACFSEGEPRVTDTGLHSGQPDYQACDDTTSVLEQDVACALGFAADDVLAVVAGPASAPATWTDGGAVTTVTIGSSLAGEVVYHDRSPAADTGSSDDTGHATGAPDDACPDWLEVPITLTLTTDDGAFDESVAASILAMDTASLWASAELDWSALGGSYVFTEIDPDEWDEVSLGVSAGWSAGAMTGQVDMNASRTVSEDMGEGITGPVLRW
jgi:hypothetical protein